MMDIFVHADDGPLQALHIGFFLNQKWGWFTLGPPDAYYFVIWLFVLQCFY